MIKYTDTHYPTDNFKWHILDKDKAEELHIEAPNIDADSNILTIDVAYVPNNMSLEEYIQFIQDNKIAINHPRKLETKKKRKKK